MPIYEYVCKSCDAKFEQLVRTMSGGDADRAKFKCPQCGSKQTARALSVFAVSSDSVKSAGSDEPPMCGRCGGMPGSCGMG